MNLSNLEESKFEEVLRIYEADHGVKKDAWELRNLKRADGKFKKWIKAEIHRDELDQIIMPYHYDCSSDESEIIPPEGLTLKEASERIQQFQNSGCYKKIQKHKGKPLKSIFLSQEPLFIGSSYLGLTKFKGKITHLDGFHRLMAVMEMKNKPEFIECYIAVYPDFI